MLSAFTVFRDEFEVDGPCSVAWVDHLTHRNRLSDPDPAPNEY